MNDVPTTMRALVLHSYDVGSYASLTLEDRPMPRPRRGEVLVRVAAAPINPSDLAFLQGLYGVKKPLPVVPGIEGSGTVVASGGGWMAGRLVGKRVACAAGDGDGTWAEYVVAPALQCSSIPKHIDDERGAMRIVNPYTAWAQLTIAHQAHARAVVQTAAASALGRMIVRISPRFGISVINVVRRDAQVESLRALGAKHVLNSETSDFDQRLGDLCRQLDARVAFDAVAGAMTGRLLAAMPPRSRVVVYGGLAMEPIQIIPGDVIFRQQRVEGFYLPHWVARQNPVTLLAMQRRLWRLSDDVGSAIQLRAPLADAQQALATYEANMSAGKVLFVPAMAAG